MFYTIILKAPAGRKRFNVLGALNAVTHALVTVTNDTYSKYYSEFKDFKKAITDCLNQTDTTHKQELDSLLTLRFQRFEKTQSVVVRSIIMLSLVNILLVFLVSHLSIPLIIMSLAIVTVLAVWTWRQSFQDNILYLHDVSNMLGGVLLGILAACWLSSQEKLISFLIPIAIIDFISFTRFGRWTPNRKLIDNPTVAKRLSICTPIPGFSGLYQITGIGDMFVFALITGATLKIWGISAVWMAITAIIVGQIPNIIGMLSFKSKPWYRGIPATSFPILIFIITIFLTNFGS